MYGDDGYGEDLYGAGTPAVPVEAAQVLQVPTIGDLGRVGNGPTLLRSGIPRRWQLQASLDGYGPLPLSFARRWWEQTNDTGIGELTLDNTDPAAQAVRLGDLIRFSVDDQPRFCARVESIESDTINEGEEIRQITRVSGRGLLAEWDRAIVRPPGGLGQRPFADLLIFNWAHPAVEIAAWSTAFGQWRQGIGAALYGPAGPLRDKVNMPMGWPDPDSWWIWGEPPIGSPPAQPAGVCLLAQDLTVDDATNVAVYTAGDNTWRLWVDGILIGESADESGWQHTARADMVLSAGTHRVAVEGTNQGGVAGVLVAVFSLDADGYDDKLLLRTDGTWKALAYPNPVPGFTAGRIIRLLLEEAQTRNQLTGWTLGFDDVNDSNGNPWPIRTETTFRVGDNLLAALRQLGETDIEFAAAPNARVLHAWRAGERGGTSTAVLQPGQNLITLNHRERG